MTEWWTIWDTMDKILCWLGLHDWYSSLYLDRSVKWPRFKVDYGVRICQRKHCKAKQRTRRPRYDSKTGTNENKIRWGYVTWSNGRRAIVGRKAL